TLASNYEAPPKCAIANHAKAMQPNMAKQNCNASATATPHMPDSVPYTPTSASVPKMISQGRTISAFSPSTASSTADAGTSNKMVSSNTMFMAEVTQPIMIGLTSKAM